MTPKNLLLGTLDMFWDIFKEAPVLFVVLILGAFWITIWALRKIKVKEGVGTKFIAAPLLAFLVFCILIYLIVGGDEWIVRTFVR